MLIIPKIYFHRYSYHIQTSVDKTNGCHSLFKFTLKLTIRAPKTIEDFQVERTGWWFGNKMTEGAHDL